MTDTDNDSPSIPFIDRIDISDHDVRVDGKPVFTDSILPSIVPNSVLPPGGLSVVGISPDTRFLPASRDFKDSSYRIMVVGSRGCNFHGYLYSFPFNPYFDLKLRNMKSYPDCIPSSYYKKAFKLDDVISIDLKVTDFLPVITHPGSGRHIIVAGHGHSGSGVRLVDIGYAKLDNVIDTNDWSSRTFNSRPKTPRIYADDGKIILFTPNWTKGRDACDDLVHLHKLDLTDKLDKLGVDVDGTIYLLKYFDRKFP